MGKKALVVDNDFFFVEFLTELLQKRGFEVIKAYDGKQGISKVDEGPYEVIFADMVMPKIDGKQFIRYIRDAHPCMDTLIIVVSGVLIEQQEDLDTIQADCYLVKGPIEMMAEHIERVLDNFELTAGSLQIDQKLIEQGDIYPNQTTVELVDNLKFLKAVVEGIPFGLILLDLDSRVIMSNPISLDIIQMPLSMVLNRPIADLIQLQDKGKLFRALKRVVQKPPLKRITFSASIKTFMVRMAISSLIIDGKPAGWVVALDNITKNEN